MVVRWMGGILQSGVLQSGVLRSVLVVLTLVTLGAYASPGTGTRAADADEIPAWRGRWNTEEELTIEPRTDASVAVAAGSPHGVVVWGGVAEDGRLLNDGVLIDSADPFHWRVMPESPLVPRRDFGWASVGDRVLVWGGVDENGRPLDDGALFQHGWMSLPQSRLPGGPASMAVVDYRLWVVATDPDTGLAQIQSMGVGIEDGASWGLVADVPLPAGERYEVVGCCGDEANELIVFAVMPDGSAVAASWDIGAARNPSFIGGQWTQLGAIPAPVGGPVVGRAVEQQLAAWVSPTDLEADGTGDGSVAVLRQVDYGKEDQWQTAPAPGGLDVASDLVLSPRHLISVSDRAVYDLADERWLRLPELHRRASFATPTGAATWWDRGRLWVLGGVAPDGTMRSDLRSFTPRLPKGTYTLPIGGMPLWKTDAGSCYYVGKPGAWTLRGDPRARPRVWMQQGARTEPLRLPDGWHARFAPKLSITDSTGTVRFRGGETCEGDTGTGG